MNQGNGRVRLEAQRIIQNLKDKLESQCASNFALSIFSGKTLFLGVQYKTFRDTSMLMGIRVAMLLDD